MSVEIKRGADKKFTIKLRKGNGDPYSLEDATKISVEFKKFDHTVLEINNIEQPATYSTVEYNGEIFNANVAGSLGSSIVLIFDGIKTITEVLAHWNDLNVTNQASSEATDPSIILPIGNAELANGFDSYKKVDVIGNTILGNIFVILPNCDTELLKVGSQQAIDIIIDKGNHPIGDRIIRELQNAIDVRE